MTISKAQVEDVERALADNSLDATVRQYSGRGMYGKQCLGITVSHRTSPFEVGLAIGSYDELVDLFVGQRVETDSMGRGMVIYFPGLKWVVEPDTLVDSSTPPVV